jgi:hypothetical protein
MTHKNLTYGNYKVLGSLDLNLKLPEVSVKLWPPFIYNQDHYLIGSAI